MVRKGNPKNIQAIDDVCGVRAVAGLGTVEEAMFRGLSDKCVAGGKPPLEIVTCPPAPYSTAQRFPDTSNFESLSEMLAAIDAAYPEAFRFSPPRPSFLIVINCKFTIRHPDRGSQVRSRLSAGGRRIRTRSHPNEKPFRGR
jgi:hypothetical protein